MSESSGKTGNAEIVLGLLTSVERDRAIIRRKLAGDPTPIAFAPARDWDRSGRRFGAPDKARERLGFAAATALRDGLRETIAWTRANRDRIRACMLQHVRFMPELQGALG